MKSRKIRWVGLIALTKKKMQNVHTFLVEKPESRKPGRRPGCRYKDNIKMEHKKIGWETGLD
jgi:hypothetical protein